MQSRKEWLKANGHITEITRGRISGENKALCEKAFTRGVRFSDWEPDGAVKSIPSSTKSISRRKVMPKPVVTEEYNEKILWPEKDYVVFERRNGKRHYRSMREACNNCRVSLVVCTCGNPRIVAEDGSDSVHVFIEERS